MTAVLSLIVKLSVVLVIAAAADLVLRRRASAAGRHLLWTCTLTSLLLLPLATMTLPRWEVVLPIASASAAIEASPRAAEPVPAAIDDGAAIAHASVASASPAQPRGSFPWLAAASAVYAAGVLLLFARIAGERFAIRWMMRSAEPVEDAGWETLEGECLRLTRIERRVRLLRARSSSTPMTFGLMRPVILLPAIADEWSVDRRRAVLLHEMAHVARHDCLTQTLAAGVCALYWIHPGVWWAARRLRTERELACDDRVLAAGTPARDYAGHLLEIAYALGRRRTPSLAVAMARPAQLEGRMLALLDQRRNRIVPRRASRLAITAATAALLMPLASLDARVAASSRIPEPMIRGNVEAAAPPASFEARVPEQTPDDDSTVGSWEMRRSDRDDVVHLRMTRGNSTNGFSIALAKFEGLTAAQLAGQSGPVHFTLRRDAGTFSFEGTIRSGVGGGTYSFAANPAFAAELEKRGLERPTAAQQYDLALGDIGAAFLDELNAQQYARPDLTQLVRAGRHGAGLDYLREMGQAGYRVGSLDTLVELRDHGVTPDYINGLAQAGYKGLSADDLRRLRDHGVTPEYIRGLADAGYKGLAADALVRVRDHGVTPDYVRALRDAGYTSLPIDDVVKARDHGVTPDFIKGLGDLARGQPLDALIRLRDHGVTPEYAKAIRDLGYTGVDADMLVRLRDRGVTAERIRRANERAGTRLPLDMIEQIRSERS